MEYKKLQKGRRKKNNDKQMENSGGRCVMRSLRRGWKTASLDVKGISEGNDDMHVQEAWRPPYRDR